MIPEEVEEVFENAVKRSALVFSALFVGLGIVMALFALCLWIGRIA